jgi:hypothetical protein
MTRPFRTLSTHRSTVNLQDPSAAAAALQLAQMAQELQLLQGQLADARDSVASKDAELLELQVYRNDVLFVNAPIYIPICSLKTQPICSLKTQPICSLKSQHSHVFEQAMMQQAEELMAERSPAPCDARV